nr:TonB-dependent receptor [Xanthomonas axonopodis]
MGQPPGRPDENPALFFDDREDSYAIYAQANYGFSLGPIAVDGRVGARATRLDSQLQGSQSLDGVLSPVSIDPRIDKVLPNYSVNLTLRENLMLRLAGSTTITRPEFADLKRRMIGWINCSCYGKPATVRWRPEREARQGTSEQRAKQARHYRFGVRRHPCN